MNQALDGLREDALLIGFARRFAPYKRAHLLFQDTDRLRRLLEDDESPLRIVVAGKAHPKDERGKDILQSIAEIARSEEFIGKVFFIENYDMDLARSLVQGVDVWLNNPTRMLEASGTSGMKVSANGGLNLSIGDGWWPEAFDGENGWIIADNRVYEDQELQDQFDSGALYRLLEEQIVPEYFERRPQGLTGQVAEARAGQFAHHPGRLQHRPHGRRLSRTGLQASSVAPTCCTMATSTRSSSRSGSSIAFGVASATFRSWPPT